MLICPDCGTSISSPIGSAVCSACTWRATAVQGIPCLLSTRDRGNPLFQAYQSNYDSIAAKDVEKSIQPERYIQNQSKRFLSYLEDLSGKTVADVGAGKGYLTRLMADRGADTVYAVDITPNYFEHMRKNEKIIPLLANAENLPFMEEMDVVVGTDVMEHVVNLASFLFCLNRALKMGGRAYIRVPFREKLMCYSPHLGCSYEFVHLRNFNEELLRDLMESAGFEIERFELDGFWPNLPQKLWQKNRVTKAAYQAIIARLQDRQQDPLDLTLLPAFWARLLMRPIEITVIGSKRYDLHA